MPFLPGPRRKVGRVTPRRSGGLPVKKLPVAEIARVVGVGRSPGIGHGHPLPRDAAVGGDLELALVPVVLDVELRPELELRVGVEQERGRGQGGAEIVAVGAGGVGGAAQSRRPGAMVQGLVATQLGGRRCRRRRRPTCRSRSDRWGRMRAPGCCRPLRRERDRRRERCSGNSRRRRHRGRGRLVAPISSATRLAGDGVKPGVSDR